MNPIIVTVSRNGHMLDFIASQLAARGVSWIPLDPRSPVVIAIVRHMPELVMLDTGMDSEARVLEFVSRLKDRYPDIPVFLVAHKSSETLAIGVIKAGVDDYFKSPYSAEFCR